jgi:hypothetical protein
MTYGTSHFVDLAAALKYYKAYGYDKPAVKQKLAEGQIHLGPPTLKPGETLRVIDNGTRYQITEAK